MKLEIFPHGKHASMNSLGKQSSRSSKKDEVSGSNKTLEHISHKGESSQIPVLEVNGLPPIGRSLHPPGNPPAGRRASYLSNNIYVPLGIRKLNAMVEDPNLNPTSPDRLEISVNGSADQNLTSKLPPNFGSRVQLFTTPSTSVQNVQVNFFFLISSNRGFKVTKTRAG
jgi:hypothetical protein